MFEMLLEHVGVSGGQLDVNTELRGGGLDRDVIQKVASM